VGWIIGIVVVVVIGALVVALAVGRSDDDSGSSALATGAGGQDKGTAGTVVKNGDQQFGTVTVSGTTLEKFPTDGSTDPATGATAPGLTGTDFSGAPASIAPDGKPKVIIFLAHWCPHCRAEVPRIQQWIDQNGLPTDVELWSVPTGTDPKAENYPPSNWLVGEQWTVPVLVDDQQDTAANAFGLSSYPYFVAVGSDGKVVQRGSGELTMPQFESLLQAARTDQPQQIS
jgi:thiol-disulfide isomerase/thioredoxin